MKCYITYSLSHREELDNDVTMIAKAIASQQHHAHIKTVDTVTSTKIDKNIRSCDFMIANLTYPSSAVGFEVAMALHLNKPVLVLYRSGSNLPSLLADIESELVMYEAYTPSNIIELIVMFSRFAQSHTETRFTFFITPAIASHLKKMAQHYKMPKSVYLRRLIEKDMASHTSR